MSPLRGWGPAWQGRVRWFIISQAGSDGRAPVAFRVTVGAASTELDEGLSRPVAAAVPTAIAAIQALLTGHAAPQHSLI